MYRLILHAPDELRSRNSMHVRVHDQLTIITFRSAFIPTFTFTCHRPSYPQTVLYQTLTQEQDSVPNSGVVVDRRDRVAVNTRRMDSKGLLKRTDRTRHPGES